MKSTVRKVICCQLFLILESLYFENHLTWLSALQCFFAQCVHSHGALLQSNAIQDNTAVINSTFTKLLHFLFLLTLPER